MSKRPFRIQLRRTKGWRIPPNTIKVDRSGRFGNIYKVGLVACGCRSADECDHNSFRRATQAEAVEAFRDIPRSPKAVASLRAALRGHNLGCWCKLCERHAAGKPFGEPCPECAPCHADVLGEIANG
jgi:hypothetical protein